MNDQEYFNELWRRSMIGNVGCGAPMFVCLIAILFLLCSCTTPTKIEYVDREVVRYVTKIQHDTLIKHTHDSVYHTVFQKGDTVYDTKYVEKTRWRDRIVERHDTCWRDSVVTEYKETVKEVVKFPKTYWYAVGISFLFFIFAFIKLVRWLQVQ